MSDIRLIIAGSVIVFASFYVMAMAGAQYEEISVQANQFDQCFDYSSGTAVHVNCMQKEHDAVLLLALATGILGGGAFVIFKGIRGRWDQDVKSDEMLGPKN